MNERMSGLLLLLAAAACTPQSGPSGPNGSPLEVFPAAIYTGVDEGGNAYVAPLVATDVSASFQVSGGCCTLSGGSGTGQARVTASQAGSGVVTVTAGGAQVEVPVEVVMYTAAARSAGASAYAANACGGCHEGEGQPDITSSGIPEHPDAEVLTAIRTGINPEGGQIEGGHSFQVPDGIVAYLRSLPPKGLPAADE